MNYNNIAIPQPYRLYQPMVVIIAPPAPAPATSTINLTQQIILPQAAPQEAFSPRQKRAERTEKIYTNWHCQKCQTDRTGERRRGPEGKNTLCNACGLQYSKEIKRIRAAMSISRILNS